LGPPVERGDVRGGSSRGERPRCREIFWIWGFFLHGFPIYFVKNLCLSGRVTVHFCRGLCLKIPQNGSIYVHFYEKLEKCNNFTKAIKKAIKVHLGRGRDIYAVPENTPKWLYLCTFLRKARKMQHFYESYKKSYKSALGPRARYLRSA